MQYNVSQLLQEPIGSTRRFELDEDISKLDADLTPVTLLTGKVELLRIHSGVLVTGDLTVTMEVSCSRCLEPVPMQVSFHLEESFHPITDVVTGRFIPPQEFEGSEEELMDPALIIDDHHILDISEIVRQEIWLTLPMYPGCIWDDPASCPNFAKRIQDMKDVHADLAEGDTDADETEAIDPRWARLLSLREQLEDK